MKKDTIIEKSNDFICPRCNHSMYSAGGTIGDTYPNRRAWFKCENCDYEIEEIDHVEVKPVFKQSVSE